MVKEGSVIPAVYTERHIVVLLSTPFQESRGTSAFSVNFHFICVHCVHPFPIFHAPKVY